MYTLKVVMKKNLFQGIMAAAYAASFFLIPAALPAAESDDESKIEKTDRADRPGFTIGFQCHYTWWDAGLIQSDYGLNEKTGKVPASGFMYNPVVALRINRTVSLSTSFNYGKFTYSGGHLQRFDADLLVNVAVYGNLVIFMGPKYMGFGKRFNSVGIGFGVSYSHILYKGLFVSAAVSGISLFDRNLFNADNKSAQKTADNKDISYVFGGAASAALGYFFEAISTSVIASFRCQYLYYTAKPISNYKRDSDLFFGPYLGVVYSY